MIIAKSYRFLYKLFIAVDANFKLKNKERGIFDLELGPGWAYYVEDNHYQTHLSGYVDQPEVIVVLRPVKLSSLTTAL